MVGELPDIWPLIEAALAGNASYRENLPLTMKRKGFVEQTWFTFSYSPVRDESGAVAGMFCVVAETTAQVLAEQEASAERKVLADIVEGTDAFVQVCDLNYRWLAINKAAADEFARIFGVRPKVGQSMLDVLEDQPRHRDEVKAVWSRALAGEQFTEVSELGAPDRDRRVYEMKFNILRDRNELQMAGEGTLTISARLKTAAKGLKLKSGSYVCLAVRDTGTGMDEHTLRRAIEPFFTTKGVGRGTGLGLSSVQGLAEQSGGDFQLESQPGKGTTATIWLPASEEVAVAPSISLEPEILGAKAENKAILLVDDEELVRVGTADMLAEAGYTVTEASSGYRALRLIEDGLEFDALVTDFAMPGMTGVELAQEALALRPDLQVLLITGYDTGTQHLTVGLPRLAKPFRQADLVEAVADLLRDRTGYACRPAQVQSCRHQCPRSTIKSYNVRF